MKRVVAAAALIVMLMPAARAQTPSPPNAALRYWMAFAMMHDPPADKATSELIERVETGAAPWDEAKLGTIVDGNRQALDIMRRASILTSCDWGLEYELGPRTPIAHLAKARVLGGLSVLAGIRLASKGQTSQAIDQWLASVRFSQHMAQGGSLIALLSGRRVMAQVLRALQRTLGGAPVDAADRRRVEDVVRALPETGFDWSAAMRREEASIDVTAKDMAAAPNPRAYIAGATGVPGASIDFDAPSAADLAAFHAFMARIEAALALPFDQARPQLAEVERTRSSLHPFFLRYTANVSVGFGDPEIPGRRKSLLDALARSK